MQHAGLDRSDSRNVSVSYSGMVSIVFTWNFKFLYCFLYFYNYKQVILYSQTHQKKLERIDKVDERFWPLSPSDTRRDKEEIESDNGKRKWNRYLYTHASTRHVPILTQSPWKFPNGP